MDAKARSESGVRRLLAEAASEHLRHPGSAILARAPGRLDVMGGIADYSGSTVLEGTLELAAWAAIEPRDDDRLVAVSAQAAAEDWADTVSWARGDLISAPYDQLREAFAHDRRTHWAAYVLGAWAVLAREGALPKGGCGATLALFSDVPIGAGVSSSAAIEVASMAAIDRMLGLHLGGLELARLCQIVENRVAGAPCGIMDMVTAALGERGALLALRCQPHDVLGNRSLPERWAVYGINSAVRHAVGAGRYTRTRVAAFMGLEIIARDGRVRPQGNYLCKLTPAQYSRQFRALLPSRLSGEEFTARYGATADPITTVRPGVRYSVRGCTEHPIYENHRVERFLDLMADGSLRAAEKAGALMYGSHWSYGHRAGLGCAETDLIVRLVRERGPERGLMGAKITGGGSGGTVAVLTYGDARQAVDEVASEYAERTGNRPHVFEGSSPGAVAWLAGSR